MAVDIGVNSILNYGVLLLPVIITSFLVLISVFNQNAKGLIFLLNVLVLAVGNLGLQKFFKVARPTDYDEDNCQLLDFNSGHSLPDFNSNFLAFVLAYLCWPMIEKETQPNIPLIIVLFILNIANIFFRYRNKCSSGIGLGLGSLVGLLYGSLTFLLWYSIDKKLVFIDAMASNKVACSRPSKQTFKCAVYKNGQLVKNL